MTGDGLAAGFALGVVFTLGMSMATIGLCVLVATREDDKYDEPYSEDGNPRDG